MDCPPPAYPRPVLVSCPPTPGLPLPQPPQQQAQPKTVKLRSSWLRALPYRLTHPPSVRGRLASWGVVPRFDISLDDILDRKHFPPLGLKDFEEWLLFVEQAAENLYFILWLREYTTRYSAWVQQSRRSRLSRSTSAGARTAREYRTPAVPPPPSPALALFYLRAKQTFLTPNAPYELDVPSDVLAPFHVGPGAGSGASGGYKYDYRLSAGEESMSSHAHAHPSAWGSAWEGFAAYAHAYGLDGTPSNTLPPPPPDPAVFNELAERVRAMLRASLARFVLATYNNVGTPRAVCGSAGGAVISLAGSVPLIVNFATGGARWWRVLALPVMWLGLTIFISAMYGVCMMIYVFGDLRQLRSFELVRPPISLPKPLRASPSTPSFLSSPTANASPSTISNPTPTSPLGQLLPFRRARRRAVPEISSPFPVAPVVVPITRPLRTAPPAGSDRAAPPKLRIVTPDGLGSRWSDETALREPPKAITHSSRSGACAEGGRRLSRVSSLASVSSCADDCDGCGASDCDSGYGLGCGSDTDADADAPRIEISDAFYDEHPPPEGPATAPFPGPAPLWPDYVAHDDDELTATATFIHPFVYARADAADEPCAHTYAGGAADLEAARPAARQPVDPFDFDALPRRRPRFAAAAGRAEKQRGLAVRVAAPGHAGAGALRNPRALLSFVQSKCSPGNVVRAHLARGRGRAAEKDGRGEGEGEEGESEKEKDAWAHRWGPVSPLAPSPTVTLAGSPLMPTFAFPAPVPAPAPAPPPRAASAAPPAPPARAASPLADGLKSACPEKASSWHARFRRVTQVPAFAAPLTPVLSPVVTRAQWEIVVRSMVVSALVCAALVGGLLGVPVTHPH
ncbi:hypothetical protein AcW2_007366 [Taiwanofungus camphoratus]|nr:hypothetical protein AcW2_007366 [Antrodia cinnamomea]